MKVMKATDAAVDAIRKMESISRSLIGNHTGKSGSFISEEVGSKYTGPFAASWHPSRENDVVISCAPEYMGVTGYCGSICTPDMMIAIHVGNNSITYAPASGNTLLVLKATWYSDGTIEPVFQFTQDPWTTCTSANLLIAADALNPVTQEYPYRNPRLAIYPIARISGTKIAQIQFGHIVDYNRWWRL